MESTNTQTSRAAELEKLRQELLRKIVQNESQRQGARGTHQK